MKTLAGLLEMNAAGDGFQLARLCGERLAAGGPARAQGVAVLATADARYEAGTLACQRVRRLRDGVEARLRAGDGGLEWRVVWRADRATGVVSRHDTLVNTGRMPQCVTRCLARVALPPGRYEVYTQMSRWCHENQGAWQPLHAGLHLSHLSGRTTEGATPYLAIRRAAAGGGLACHLLPRGNWTIRATPVPDMGELPFAVLELGPDDDTLRRPLPPGGSIELPEILFHSLPAGGPHPAAPALHRHLLANHFLSAKPCAPLVYNTWFDQFEILDVPRLRKQLAAAKAVGCEVFVVDAGWYGAGGPDWWAQAGDWREKTRAAFRGRMRAFAGEVRAAGLRFGLWMEPERFGPAAPVRADHPEWFIPCGAAARIDLTQPAARAWLRREIGRLVETYRLGWMKVDFNFALDTDASGAGLADYTAAWHGLLDEVRAAHPDTFFEGCSSGAMRGDLETLRHFDGHFLSDSVNPIDMLRITQGAWLRLPPGRLTRWTVVRPAGKVLPRYTMRVNASPAAILVPGGALWEPAECVDLDFALLAAMPGMFGLSGDLAGLTPGQRERVAAAVAFCKRWRRLIASAEGHLLTPPLPLECREGWIGLQLLSASADTSLVFLYRLGHAGAPPAFALRGLQPARTYRVECGLAGGDAFPCAGETLMRDGLTPPRLPAGHHSAQVFVVRPARARTKPSMTRARKP